MTTATNKIRAFMRAALQEDIAVYDGDIYVGTGRPSYLDDCGICNLTTLAEDCAHELGHDEWLDDPDHEVWEIAVDMADRLGCLG